MTEIGTQPPLPAPGELYEIHARPLESVYRPRSVAVVGASERADSLGGQTLVNLIRGGFAGALYPVNPRRDVIGGLPAYATVKDIPGPVDLAMILAPAERTPGIVEECAEAGVRAVAICAAGFGETGTDGERAQQSFVAVARASGLRVLGPNCQGVMYQPSRLVASFSAAFADGVDGPGGAAYVGQSGALGGAFYSLARARGIGVTGWFSLGNQADVTVCEFATEMLEDEAVRVLALHLEELPDGADFETLLRSAEVAGKTIVVLRGGSSDAGRRAIASHTGAMVADDRPFELFADAHGAIRVSDVDELVHSVGQALTGSRLRGPRVAVVTSSGGAGALAADRLSESTLTLADFSDGTRETLAGLVPSFGSTTNPVDVTAQLFAGCDGRFVAVCDTVLADEQVDALLVVLTNLRAHVAEHVARGLASLVHHAPKPVATAWLSKQATLPGAGQLLDEAGLLPHASVREAVATLERLGRAAGSRSERREEREAPVAEAPLAVVLPPDGAVLLEDSGALVLERLGIAHPRQAVVASADAAPTAVEAVGGRAVLKVRGRLDGAELAHKTDVGGLVFDVTPIGADVAFRRLVDQVTSAAPGVEVLGALVQEQMPPGLELLVGVSGASDGYPPVVTVAVGGVMTELLGEVVSALAPLAVPDAIELLQRLRLWPVLAGYRGRSALDVEAVAAAVSACSRAAVELGERLVTLEINPLLVYERGVCAADFLLMLVGTPPDPGGAGRVATGSRPRSRATPLRRRGPAA